MRKFKAEDSKAVEILYKGTKYFFLVDNKGIGIRREDCKNPTVREVRALTEYIILEGWADGFKFDKEEKEW